MGTPPGAGRAPHRWATRRDAGPGGRGRHRRRGSAVEPLGQRGAREDQIEGAQPLRELRQGRQEPAHLVGQLREQALLLVPLLEAHTRELVVERDRLLGLDEHGGAALRPVVDDAAHGAARVVPEGNDVAAVPQVTYRSWSAGWTAG
jgi:hypothetical protein